MRLGTTVGYPDEPRCSNNPGMGTQQGEREALPHGALDRPRVSTAADEQALADG